MEARTAVVLGATGLIGSYIVNLLLEDDTFSKIRVLVRKPFGVEHPKLEPQIVDFSNINDFKSKLGKGDSIFCSVGTTQQKVKGNKEAYKKVDYNIPVHAARLASEADFSQYLLVSSVGANAAAKNFYLQLKGEVEEEVAKWPFKSIHIFQPSMLLGDRREFRLGEVIGKSLMSTLSFVFAGSLKKYKAIQAEDVARAMVAASKKGNVGLHRYQYDEMMRLVGEYNRP